MFNLKVWLNNVLALIMIFVLLLANAPTMMKFGLTFWGLGFLNLNVLLSEKSLIFLTFVILIALSVFSWGRFYMSGDNSVALFFIVLTSFVASMLVLIMSDSYMLVFLGWEGLGISSFLLIVFYQNWMSVKGGLLTLLTNRVGDALLMLTFCYWVGVASVWSIGKGLSSLVFSLFLITACTKSAQVPFTSWLPAAMAAPTPVSALVHSSTLVTAGIWLMIRFGSTSMMWWLVWFIFGTMTLLVASSAAMAESDGKKVVALSTLSQLGLMFMSLSAGAPFVCLFHLLMHALAKANLFLIVGNLLHLRFSQQDARQLSTGSEELSSSLMMLISILSLSGVAFSSGFLSKDLILLSHFSKMNSIFTWIILMSVASLTMAYCYKLLLLLSGSTFFSNLSLSKSKFSLFSSMILSSLCLVMGSFYMFNSSWFPLLSGSPSSLYWILVGFGLVISFFVFSVKGWLYYFIMQSKFLDFFIKEWLQKGIILSQKTSSTFLEPVYLFSGLSPSNVITSQTFRASIIVLFAISVLIFL